MKCTLYKLACYKLASKRSCYVNVMLPTKSPRLAFTSSVFARKRSFSNRSLQPLDLHYERVGSPSTAATGPIGPLVICHGLLCVFRTFPANFMRVLLTPRGILYSFSGSKQNWRSLSKAFATRLHTDIYSLVIPFFQSD